MDMQCTSPVQLFRSSFPRCPEVGCEWQALKIRACSPVEVTTFTRPFFFSTYYASLLSAINDVLLFSLAYVTRHASLRKKVVIMLRIKHLLII